MVSSVDAGHLLPRKAPTARPVQALAFPYNVTLAASPTILSPYRVSSTARSSPAAPPPEPKAVPEPPGTPALLPGVTTSSEKSSSMFSNVCHQVLKGNIRHGIRRRGRRRPRDQFQRPPPRHRREGGQPHSPRATGTHDVLVNSADAAKIRHGHELCALKKWVLHSYAANVFGTPRRYSRRLMSIINRRRAHRFAPRSNKPRRHAPPGALFGQQPSPAPPDSWLATGRWTGQLECPSTPCARPQRGHTQITTFLGTRPNL